MATVTASRAILCKLWLCVERRVLCQLRPLQGARELVYAGRVRGARGVSLSLRGAVSASRSLEQVLARSVSATRQVILAVQGVNRVTARRKCFLSMPLEEADTPPRLWAAIDGREVGLVAAELTADEDSFVLQGRLELAEVADWLRAEVGAACVLHCGEQEATLRCTGRSRSREPDSEQYLVDVSSPAAWLAAPFAKPVTRAWENVTAKAIALELCAEAGLSLDWRICDWLLESFSLEGQTPMEALTSLATDAARVLSAPDGSLVVRYLYPQSPTRYGEHTPEAVFSDIDDLLQLDAETETRPGYDAVELCSSPEGGSDIMSLTAWNGPDNDSFLDLERNQRMVAVFTHPAREVALQSSGCGTRILPQGVSEFTHEETVEFVDGAGGLTYPARELLEVTWRCADLGELTIDAATGTGLTAATEGQSLARVRYVTGCLLFLVEHDTREPVQLYAQVPEDAAGGSLVVTVKRGAGGNPAPDCIEDPMCRSLAILKERGRNYLDAQGASKQRYEASTTLRELLLPGALAQVLDAAMDEAWRGKITGWSLSAQESEMPVIVWDVERSV